LALSRESRRCCWRHCSATGSAVTVTDSSASSSALGGRVCASGRWSMAVYYYSRRQHTLLYDCWDRAEQSRAEQRQRMDRSPVQSPSPRREAKQNEGEAGSLDCTCVCVLACLGCSWRIDCLGLLEPPALLDAERARYSLSQLLASTLPPPHLECALGLVFEFALIISDWRQI